MVTSIEIQIGKHLSPASPGGSWRQSLREGIPRREPGNEKELTESLVARLPPGNA